MSSEQEQIAQGSLKSSHRNTHAAVLKRANNFQSQKAIEFLNSTNLDLVIQQRISSDKAEIPLKKGTFFIQTFITKSEPGFLVFLPNLPAIFVKYNLTKKERLMTKGQPLCYLLRFRVSVKVNEGSVFVASIDTINTSTDIASDQDRIVKSTFNIKLNGYVIPDIIQKDTLALKKLPSLSQIIFSTEVTSSLQ
jgi:hypothetical protein